MTIRTSGARAQSQSGAADDSSFEGSGGAFEARAELERLRYVASAARAGIWDFQIDTQALTCSDRWYEIIGLDPSRPISSVDEFKHHIHPEDVERATEVNLVTLAELAAKKQDYHIEFRIVRPSGEIRWVRSVACLVPGSFGVPQRAVGFIVDVTEEHLLEESGRYRVRSLEALINRSNFEHQSWTHSSDLQAVIDRSGMVRAVNAAWTRVLGYSTKELIGHNVAEFVLQDGGSPDRRCFDAVLDGAQSRGFETRVIRKDGELCRIGWNAWGEHNLVFVYGSDVDGRQLVDSRQSAPRWPAIAKHDAGSGDSAERAAAEELQRRQLEAALHQAQKMTAMGQLVSGIAHDFANALQSIDTPLSVAEWLVSQGRAGEVARLVATARTSTKHATGVARRLLNLSKASALELDVLDVSFVAKEFVNLMRELVGSATEIDLVCFEAAPVIADANQLESVLLNLCVNARHAMPDGGEIEITVANVDIEAAAAHELGLQTGPYVHVSVADTGSGMSDETLSRALEPFFTTKEPGEGTGLGLFMAANFVRRAGGQIHIASRLRQGTVVSLYLPRAVG